jgi:hypothetical protein
MYRCESLGSLLRFLIAAPAAWAVEVVVFALRSVCALGLETLGIV